MSNKILFFLALTLLIACSKPKKEQAANDETDGLVKTYGKDGNLFSEITMKDGKRNGISRNYYKNGRISIEANYKDDVKDGVFKQYYEDGTLSMNFEYTNNRLNGLSKKFRQDGTPAWEARFENDKPCTGLVEYYLNGSLKTDYPRIIIEQEDRLRDLGEYSLIVRLNNDSKPVKFYKGQLSASGCFDQDKAEELYLDRDGKFKLTYYLSPGDFQMEEVHLVGVLKTAQGNSYLMTRSYNLSITN